MKPTKNKLTHQIILICLLILSTSCSNYKEAPPFPYAENEYQQPKTKNFEFSKPDTLQWVTSKLKTLPVKTFSCNKTPSKPIDIGIPYHLKTPLTTKPFYWDSLPGTGFSLENLSKQDLKIKTTILGSPKIVKAASPVIRPHSSRGVMQIDDNFGLPGTNYCSVKDKDGLLWFGTNNGIVRYDSENMEIYGEDQGLNIGSVYSMLFDKNGRLWLTDNSNSIFVIDIGSNLIHQLTNPTNSLDVYGMLEDNEGRIWIANRDFGYIIINLKEKWSRKIDPKNGLLGTFTITPFQDSKGLIWLSTNGGATILDLKAGKNISLTIENGLMSNFITSFFEDKDGKIWISGGGGIQILNKERTDISYFTPEEGLEGLNAAGEIFYDNLGVFWIGTGNGLLFSYNEITQTLNKYILNPNNRQFVFNILEDNQGQIWASIAQGGLYKIDLNTGKPGNFTKSNGLTDNGVWSTLEAKDGKIWIATQGGLDIYDPKNKSLKHLGVEHGLVDDYTYTIMEDSSGRIWAAGNNVGVSIIDPNKETIQKFTQIEGLGTGSVRSFLEDNSGLIWMGGNRGELLTVDLKNSISKSVNIDTISPQNAIMAIANDSKGNIWLATRGSGIQIVNPKTNSRIKLSTTNGLISDQVFSMIKDDENIWIATQKGVQQIDPLNQKLTTFTTEEGLAANDVYDLAKHKGKIFTGTSKGFTILKQIEKGKEQSIWELTSIGKKQGINEPDISQNSITFDKNGRLWAGGNALQLIVMDEVKDDLKAYSTAITGINIMDRKRVFYAANLMQDKNAKDSNYLTLNNIQWATVKGAYNIPIDLILPNTQNYLSFNFNGGQFANRDKVVYRYILEGIDKNWSPVTQNTESENYRDLPSGDYNFKVSSKGFNGVWSSPTEFKFSITPPWWQTWWAYTIFVVLFLGLGLVILHYRSQYLKNENRILEEKVNDRTAELKKTIDELENTQSQLIHSEKMASLGELTAGIAHEIQNPMNFINNFSEVSIELIDEMNEEMDKGDYKEAKTISTDIAQNLDKINHHGKRASSIVKGMLEHSRNTSGIKELTDINVLADEYLRLSYHGLKAKNKSFNADFKTDLDKSLPKVEVVPQDLGRVILNLINNAFYAVSSIPEEEREENYKPLVMVITKRLKDQVLIKVKDNGPGISKEIKEKIFQPFFTTKPTGKGTGLGLSLAYDIITQGHGGAIELETAPGKGTEFSIYIPL